VATASWVDALRKQIDKVKLAALKSATTSGAVSQRKSGWLEKHGEGLSAQLGLAWSKVWVVMKGGVLYTFRKPGEKQRDKLPLYKCVLEEYKAHKYEGTTFSITTWVAEENRKTKQPETVAFKCKDQEELHDWLNCLVKQKNMIEDAVETIVSVD